MFQTLLSGMRTVKILQPKEKIIGKNHTNTVNKILNLYLIFMKNFVLLRIPTELLKKYNFLLS